jgi:hypothetical protein
LARHRRSWTDQIAAAQSYSVAGSLGTVVGGAAGASLKLRRNALRVSSLMVGFPLRQL